MRKKTIRALICDPRALQAIQQFTAPFEVREAFSTRGALEAMGWANLIVCNPEQLYPDRITPAMLQAALEQWEGIWVRVETFISSPLDYQGAAAVRIGHLKALPPKVVAVTGFGGVGKTTLVLSAARTFARRAKLPVTAVEMDHAPSSFRQLLTIPDRTHDFYELASLAEGEEIALPNWEGVTLVPSDVELVLSLGEGAFRRGLSRAIERHILTLLDLAYPHPFFSHLLERTDLVVVVALPRKDSLEKARWLMGEIRRISPEKEVKLVLNRVSFFSKLGLAGIEREADVPEVGGAWEFPPRVGRALLKAIYPGW